MYHTLDEWVDIERHRTLEPNEVVQLLEDWKETRLKETAPASRFGRIAEWRNRVAYLGRQSSGVLLDSTPLSLALEILDDWERDKVYLLSVIRDVSQKLAAAAARYEELLF